MKTVVKISSLLVVALLALSSATTSAQTYPDKPIRFVVSYPAGGGTDILARIVAQKVSEHIGQPVVVENKPGANGAIGAQFVAKAAPDGYTFLFGSNAETIMNVGLYHNLPYDPIKDFVPVTMTASFETLIAANPAFPGKTMNDLVAMAKAKPGSIFYAYGNGFHYVATELFKSDAGINIAPVPYKGVNAADAAAAGGEVPIVITSPVPSAALIKAGKLRPVARTGSKRSASMPDVPSTGEQGVHFDGLQWNGLFAPAGTPQPVIDKLYGAVKAALADPDLLKRYKVLSIDTDIIGMPPAEFASFFHTQLTKTVKGIRALGLKAN